MLVAAIIVLASHSAYAEPDQTAQALFKNLMAATVSNNTDATVVRVVRR